MSHCLQNIAAKNRRACKMNDVDSNTGIFKGTSMPFEAIVIAPRRGKWKTGSTTWVTE